MKNEFVSYKQALSLKKLGFDEPCLFFYLDKIEKKELNLCFDEANTNSWFAERDYENSFTAPLKQQVFRWFREKYDAHMYPSRLMRNIYVVRYGDWDSEAFKTYEEAENACIDKLIQLAKQQNNGDIQGAE